MTNAELARHYQAADIAVWPRQESMSMLDAGSSGLPVIVSDRIGEPARVEANGRLYEENSAESLAVVIKSFESAQERQKYGAAGRQRMVEQFSWLRFAKFVEADFQESVAGQ
jgi:glycosyltransferase involved in cell wall biosynthesis